MCVTIGPVAQVFVWRKEYWTMRRACRELMLGKTRRVRSPRPTKHEARSTKHEARSGILAAAGLEISSSDSSLKQEVVRWLSACDGGEFRDWRKLSGDEVLHAVLGDVQGTRYPLLSVLQVCDIQCACNVLLAWSSWENLYADACCRTALSSSRTICVWAVQ